MPAELIPVLQRVLAEYAWPWFGDHGVAHSARVWEIGTRLAERSGGDPYIVGLFAVVHDARRWNAGTDPEHGPRAAEFARSLRGAEIELDAAQFALLERACAGHTHEHFHSEPTIQTCWDADRLDLGRVGITPDVRRLGTAAARDPQCWRWAHQRAVAQEIPEFVATVWRLTATEARGRRRRSSLEPQ